MTRQPGWRSVVIAALIVLPLPPALAALARAGATPAVKRPAAKAPAAPGAAKPTVDETRSQLNGGRAFASAKAVS